MLLLIPLALAVPPVSGRWSLYTPTAGIEAEQSRALEPTLAAVPGPLRGIAARLVERSFFYCAVYDLAVDDSHAVVGCDSRAQISAIFGAEPFQFEGELGAVMVSATATGPAFHVHLETPDGTRDSVFTLEGPALVVTITVASPKLQAPVSWTMQYHRAP